MGTFKNLFKLIYFGTMMGVVTLFYAFSIIFTGLFYSLIRKPYPTAMGHNFAIRWGKKIMGLTPGWEVEILGKEHLPKDKPYVLVANHESTTDIFAIYLLGIQFKWIAKKELFHIPIFGYSMGKLGYVPIKRGDKEAHKKALNACKAWIYKGFSVLFFPEGTRSTEGKPKKFKIGAFKLAKETQSPVLPIVLSGAGKLLKKGTLVPHRAKLKISVLPPVAALEEEGIEEFTLRVQKLIIDEHLRLSARSSIKKS